MGGGGGQGGFGGGPGAFGGPMQGGGAGRQIYVSNVRTIHPPTSHAFPLENDLFD